MAKGDDEEPHAPRAVPPLRPGVPPEQARSFQPTDTDAIILLRGVM